MFMDTIQCTELDKEVEMRRREEKKIELSRLYEKVRKIHDSIGN